MPTTIAILSIGQMGAGIASLLHAHNFTLITNVSDRSAATQERARAAAIECLNSDEELVARADYILSIVPPRDAVQTASRIVGVLERNPSVRNDKKEPLYYLDLNAISPATARKIEALFTQDANVVRFVDGGIIGGPPSRPTTSNSQTQDWKCPSIPLSGPHPLAEAPIQGSDLATILTTQHLDERVGTASGLKCTFAALLKGFTALALQSFTTASSLGVLPQLQGYLSQHTPGMQERAEKGITGCPAKAYRWVEEMRQIGECFASEGGWPDEANVFRNVAGVYEGLAEVVERRGGVEGMAEFGGALEALEEGLKGKREGL